MTRRLRYHRLDVFTDTPFCGNPLAIVEDADGLAADEMQAVAREFNLSETVFLQAPRDPVHTARLRIFTPQTELPFAGHPTIGAAAFIAESRAGDILLRSDVVIALEAEIGLLRCEALRSKAGVVFAQFVSPAPRKLGPAPPPEAIAAALSLAAEDIGFGGHQPTCWSAGVPFLFAPVASREILDRAQRGVGFAATLAGVAGVYVYSRETADPVSAVHARMLANGLGVDEDPATGSAVAAFAGVAHEFERPSDGEHEIFIEQGHKIGRPSRLTLGVSVEAGRLTAVRVGGQVVSVGEGTLRL